MTKRNGILSCIGRQLGHGWLPFVICNLSFVTLTGCRIEPPLLLPDEINASGALGEVEVELEVIWEIDANWRNQFWYGWDSQDIAQWGDLVYPEPSNYELRFFYLGDQLTTDGSYQSHEGQTIYSKLFRRRFSYGYHDLLAWSNIDSPDGTQVLTLNETNPRSVEASTSQARSGITTDQTVYNSPEIFYGGWLNGFYIDQNPENYDYFDEEYQTWVKRLEASLYPLVYIYVVQVAVYNNQGRITGLADDAVISNLSRGVTVNSGYTHNLPIAVAYPMRMKSSLPARDGREADILGGRLNTFGLCDMPPWHEARGAPYKGSRSELKNRLMLDFLFKNSMDSTYSYDITDQLQAQSHGGVITIEIDMDTVKIPVSPGSSGSGFDPTVNEYTDTIIHEFPM